MATSTKRQDYIGWDAFFMSVAAAASFRCKDPNTQNGACIVNPVTHRIQAVGYNGFPRGCSDDEFPWTRDFKDPLNSKDSYVIHAERNCIHNRQGSIEGGVMYLFSERGYYPCSTCAQDIAQNGIVEVVMAFAREEPTEAYDWRPTKKIFKAADVKIRIMENAGIMFRDMARKFDKIADGFFNDKKQD